MRRACSEESRKWKSPGKDKTPNFWLNVFHGTHTRLIQHYNLIMTDPKQIPLWVANANSYSLRSRMRLKIPKTIFYYLPNHNVQNLKSSLTEYKYSFLIDNGLFQNEQKWSLKNVATAKLTCRFRRFTTKRSIIVYLIHGLKNVLKCSKYHLSYATFSRSICMWKPALVLNTGENTYKVSDTNIDSGLV